MGRKAGDDAKKPVHPPQNHAASRQLPSPLRQLKIRHDPLRVGPAGACDRWDQGFKLLRTEAIEKEMGNDQIINSRPRSPCEKIGVNKFHRAVIDPAPNEPLRACAIMLRLESTQVMRAASFDQATPEAFARHQDVPRRGISWRKAVRQRWSFPPARKNSIP